MAGAMSPLLPVAQRSSLPDEVYSANSAIRGELVIVPLIHVDVAGSP